MSYVDAQLVRQFAAAFAGHTGAYGRYDEATGQKRVKTLQEPIPPDAYLKHLLGEGPYLGVIPIRADSTCYFGAIDIDDDGIDLHELEAKVIEHQLPLVVCRSKSGGAHLYCFLREPVAAQLLVDCLKKWKAVLGHEKNANGQPVEIFPKQVRLAAGQIGNWINLPYYKHEETNRYAVRDHQALPLADFLAHAVTRSADETTLRAWADPALGPFADGPPCLQHLHANGFPEGSRNTGLLNVGIFLRLRTPSGWEDALVEYNAGLPAPVADLELRQIIKNLTRHDYVYTCSQYPLEPNCQKKPCKHQLYGIGHFIKEARLAALPELGHLVKIKTEPPRYRITVNGSPLQLSADQLQLGGLFKRAVFEQLSVVMPVPTAKEWDDVLRKLTAEQVEEAAPLEAGDRGLLLLLLNDFLILRLKADEEGDILRGLPWASGLRVYFRATDFLGFLQRRTFRAFETSEIYTILTDAAGLTYDTRTIKGATVKLWSVPEPTDEQSDAFDFPVSANPAIV